MRPRRRASYVSVVSGGGSSWLKDVVASLAINPNTVLKAYRDLEYKGLAGGRPGQGTFIEAALETVNLEEMAALAVAGSPKSR
jgi:DNA-binding transcriptional MocR family regulator